MKLYYIGYFLLISSILCAQTENNGINFIKADNWEQVLAKAQKKNKPIFVDFYTTWCTPCKAMEKLVYPLEEVGKVYNQNFVTVKVQIDQTSRDSEHIKSWYKDASYLEKKYSIEAYPTYLFLTPQGDPVHRFAGGLPAEKFIALANDALDPNKQSYALFEKYNPSKMGQNELREVVVKYRHSNLDFAVELALHYAKSLSKEQLQEKSNLEFIAQFNTKESIRDFALNYIKSLSEEQRLNKPVIDFMSQFLQSSDDLIFRFFYANQQKLDTIMNLEFIPYKYWFVKKQLDRVIYEEYLASEIEHAKSSDKEPDWHKLRKKLERKFNEDFASRNLIMARMKWEANQKNLEGYCKEIVNYMDKYASELEFDWGLNQHAWTVFKYSQDPIKLKKALSWSEKAVLTAPTANWMDTYANLLYKLGHKSLAVNWQNLVTKLEPDNKEFSSTLEKMNAGEPTWPDIK